MALWKRPSDPQEIANSLLGDLKASLGDNLISIILYGSGVSGEYIPAKSDLNFLAILKNIDQDTLAKLSPHTNKWRKLFANIPLFLSEEEIVTSTDIFPIEFLDMQENHRLIYGKDIFKELNIEQKKLRLELEHELKGKLILLRQSYVSDSKRLEQIILQSLSGFIPLFRNLLRLKGIKPSLKREEIVRTVAQEFALDIDVFLKLLAFRAGQMKLNQQELKEIFRDYLKELTDLARKVDLFVTS